MARLFGALANAGAQVNTNRFKRQQYDDQQAAQAREEARRALEFKAMRDQAAAQAAEARKQRELDTTLRAYDNGFEDAPDMTKLRGAGIAMDAVTGFRGGATEYTPPEDAPYETEVEGRPVRAAKMGSQYLTVGGKVLRNNRQRGANAVAQQEEAKALWDLKMKREVAQANAKAAIEARGEQAQMIEGMRGANRELVAGIAAASRQQGQQQPKPAKAPTGSQEQSYLYSKLLEGGNATMEQFKNQINPNKIGAYVNSKYMKPALTPEEQQFVVGARDFAAGVLRKESGAAIKDEELRDVMARYIDMPFDAPATRELKRSHRERYAQSMRKLASPARAYYGETDEQDTEPNATVTPPPKARPKAPGAPIPNTVPLPWETKK